MWSNSYQFFLLFSKLILSEDILHKKEENYGVEFYYYYYYYYYHYCYYYFETYRCPYNGLFT